MTDCDRLQAGHARLEHAALIGFAAFAAILIAHVHFDASDTVAVSIESIPNNVAEALLHVSSEANVIVVIHLYLHVVLLHVNGIRLK